MTRIVRLKLVLIISCLAASHSALGGEIAGLPPHLVPTTSPDYRFYLGNDFLASGTTDDFRTQQINASATIRNRWLLILDHSILTRENAVSGPPARVDLMSLSLGYKLISEHNQNDSNALTLGVGVRAVGNFEGSRIQNGIHALIESEASLLPYASTRQADPTAWILGERHKILRSATGSGIFAGWDTGYWLRGAALATTDGQFDATAGLYAIASRPGFDLWIGPRQDWREGYTADLVQSETAAEESKTALAFGVRLGSFVLEVVQRFDSAASYGQMSFVSSAATRKTPTQGEPQGDVQVGLYFPDMMFQLAGRWHKNIFTDTNSVWRESILIDARGGQPQLGHDVMRFTKTAQLTAGLEFSRPISISAPWLRFYTAGSVGWRSEQLSGRGDLAGIRSTSYDRAVLQADVGVEIDAAQIRSNWRHSLRLGVSGWLPASSVTVVDDGLVSELHQPGAAIAVVWSFNYH